jgi:hypothetical protein
MPQEYIPKDSWIPNNAKEVNSRLLDVTEPKK